ncbi:DUF2868 domain-containing protein, partial [Piscinibacter sp.]|uniref:DUF2868 domain-containing protein n=1 Tax=Piscinibacter sp. TaxID=1903157 RepID=UPI002C534232
MTSPAPAWTLADVIDFEQQLAEASGGDEDARFFESEIVPRLAGAAPHDRRAVFRAWLGARLARGGDHSVGASYETGRRALQSIALISGFVLGAALAGALLAHGVGEPINALLFFVWTVGVQWFVLALAVAAWLLRRVGAQWAPLRGLMDGLLWGTGAVLRRLPGERRDRLRSALATLKRRQDAQGSLLQWPALIVMQLFGVAFNLGLLFAMLLVHLPFAELRFGWQSTYPVSSQQVHGAAQAIATPWRWIAPGVQPTLAHIEATRYARGQNAQTLPSEAARAWWPFLVLSIACYGLLLRVLLLAAASALLRRRLARLAFDHPEANALWRRLRGPLVTARGGEAALEDRPAGAEPAPHHASGGACVVLVSEEVGMPDAELQSRVRERLGCAAQQLMRASIDDRRAAAALLAGLDAAGAAAIVVVVPASRDP